MDPLYLLQSASSALTHFENQIQNSEEKIEILQKQVQNLQNEIKILKKENQNFSFPNQSSTFASNNLFGLEAFFMSGLNNLITSIDSSILSDKTKTKTLLVVTAWKIIPSHSDKSKLPFHFYCHHFRLKFEFTECGFQLLKNFSLECMNPLFQGQLIRSNEMIESVSFKGLYIKK